MPNLSFLLNLFRSWRIGENIQQEQQEKLDSPVINIVTVLDDNQEKIIAPTIKHSTVLSKHKNEQNWFWNAYRKIMPSMDEMQKTSNDMSELQSMLPTIVTVHRPSLVVRNSEDITGGVCFMRDSPYRILKAAESGNLEAFQKLYFSDQTRLTIKDTRGRTAAHQAAAKNKVEILQFISAHDGDFNVQDNVGNTPLHVAVENESLEAVDFLLLKGVKTDILNDKKQAPIHLVTELNKVAVLEVMSKHKSKIDIQQGGEHGRTALHIAAIYDHEECARILITEFDACPRQPCNNGYYPIHEAAKNASSKTLEVFLQWGESRGCTRDEMISFYDAEGNVPLHSAVHGGDIKAVELCIKSGAKISTQQYDLSTPVHLACAQGAKDIVKLMFKMQPEEKMACLASCDIQKMTPLHCAAMFDHPEIVEYLVTEGADVNAVDKEKRSPLLLAASRGGWKTVNTLIRLGADINIKDVNRRNVLHLVVMNGGRLEQFAAEVSKCSYGRYNTARQLLDSEKGTFIINESDGEGLTPLHIASKQGHTRVVQLLLNRGALLHRDHNGRTPLHLAAMNGYTQTIELLLSVHSHLLDQLDKDGNTALHLATMENKPNAIALLLSMNCKLLYNKIQMSAIDYAIHYKFPEAALAMVTHEDRAEEVMTLRSDKHPCVTLALIASMPKVFEAVQDKCITKANCKKDSKSFYITYSFSCFECPQFYADMDGKTGEAVNISQPIPLPALNAMVSHGRVELLAHPLSQKYLQMKWNSYGKYFHLANLLFYSIFLVFVTLLSSQLMENDDDEDLQHYKPVENERLYVYTGQNENKTDLTYEEYWEKTKNAILHVKTTPFMYTGAVVITVYLMVNTIREVIQIYQQKYNYFLDPTNLVSWMLYISATITVIPLSSSSVTELQFSCASLTVFLSWFNLLLLLQRFDQVGIYVVMFLEILQTLIKVLLVFSILIIAFGLAFYILMSKGEHLSFKTVPMSLIRTFSMMLGEIDFLGTYVQPYYLKEEQRYLPFPMPAFFILCVFMVLMPILLMNLLIGLAVGDIESVRRNAQLKRLAMQVVMHTELERKLPKILLERIDKRELVEFPNESKCKLGFLDCIIRKWFGNPFSDDGTKRRYKGLPAIRWRQCGLDMVMESGEDYLMSELEKTKRKLRDISSLLETQQQLLRLIVQKMEIKTEADDVDEGVSPNDLKPLITTSSKWTSPKIRKKLQSALSFTKGNSN
ncbi:transient receptor potential cation channel subfamily A member 1 [Agrilus planipennis]|uniref:Transient receptor potential cation channel subfamily A member 1 n=1 Tax=Agrilus planipennis TaxID=224129 RepID=A0A1W4WSV1_AGRPL|nr:transient receptor potential cation channel subfamily A member 1 [Agrilus planipennis]